VTPKFGQDPLKFRQVHRWRKDHWNACARGHPCPIGHEPIGVVVEASEISARLLDYTAVDIGRAEAVVRKPVSDEVSAGCG
jgi:hypothetical protein